MKNTVLILLLIILIGLTALEFQKKMVKTPVTQVPNSAKANKTPTVTPVPTKSDKPTGKAFDGEFICLPEEKQKVLSVATVKSDCLLGLKLQDASIIALNTGDLDITDFDYKPGTSLRVYGNFVPRDQLQNEFTNGNTITGVLQVTEITEIN